MKVFNIDLKGIYSADDFQQLMGENIPLPDYYGGTLDALHDVLTEQSEGWEIHFSGCAEAEAVLGKYIRSLKRMCQDAQRENEALVVTFTEE